MAHMTHIIERQTGLPSVQPIIKPMASKPGYVKIRLTFLTNSPKHYRSYQLLAMYGLRGPFAEEAYALVPAKFITSLELTDFLPVLTFLQKNFVIGRTDRLSKVAILDENDTTLAYVYHA